MLDIAEELNAWAAEGRDFAVATVVAVSGSAPRRPGAALAVDAEGTAVGSVSGGCVEGAVYELCRAGAADAARRCWSASATTTRTPRHRADLRRNHRRAGGPGPCRRSLSKAGKMKALCFTPKFDLPHMADQWPKGSKLSDNFRIRT